MRDFLSFGTHKRDFSPFFSVLLLAAISILYVDQTIAQPTILGQDNAGNYSGNWVNGSNEGTGFGPWVLTSGIAGDGNFAGHFIGNPANAEITGMDANSFGLFANPANPANFANADRSFSTPLPVGASFSFQWGVNWDSDGAGNKGFNLYSGGTGGTQLLNINMGGSQQITIAQYSETASEMFANYGTQAITFNIRRVSPTELRVFATGRDGIESYDETFTFDASEAPDAFRFYASGLAAGDQRQPYFNNFLIRDLSGFTASANSSQNPTIPFTVTISNARDINDQLLQGSKMVTVTSTNGSFAGEGEVFNQTVAFVNGNAQFPVTLNLAGEHRLVVEIEDVTYPETITPNIIASDLSDFTASAPGSGFAGVGFNLSISGAKKVTGATLTGLKTVTITSNQQPGDGVVFNEEVFFDSSGNAVLQPVLSQSLPNPGLTHLLAISIEDVLVTKIISINIIDNNSSFEVVFLVGSSELTTHTITAGQEFSLRIKNTIQEDGLNFLSGNNNVIVSSDQQTETVTLSANFSGTGNATITINTTGDEIATVATLHTLTVTIPAIDNSRNRPGLTVNRDIASQLLVIQQPTGETGSFDGSHIPVSSQEVIVITADAWGNESAVDEAEIFVSLIDEEGTGAELLGFAVEGSFFGFDLFSESEAFFDDLTLNKNGTFRLRFFDDQGGVNEVLSEPFTMINMEDLASFEIVNPGPQLQNEEFLIPLRNAINFQGNVLNGDFIVQAFNSTNFVLYDPVLVNFELGLGYLPVTIPQTPGNKNLLITIAGIGANEANATEGPVTILIVTTDQSTFSLTDPGSQISNTPFDLFITDATDKAGNDLTGLHFVEVFDESETILFSDSLVFAAGNATIPAIALTETGDNIITVAVDWVTNPVSITINVNPGIQITDSGDNIMGDDFDNFIFPTLPEFYSQEDANSIGETFTITLLGSAPISNLTVTPSADFTVSSLSTTTLDNNTPTATFVLTPNLGIAQPGITDQLVTIEYEFGESGNHAESFSVDFPVDYFYSISLLAYTDFPPVEIEDDELIVFPDDFPFDIELTNNGTGTIENLTVFLSGADINAFELFPPFETTVDVDESVFFFIGPEFNLDPGTYNATVNVVADNGVFRRFFVRYTSIVPGVNITITPEGPLFLGVQSSGYDPANATQTVTITNTGDATITSLDFSALANFTVEENILLPLEPAEFATFTVRPNSGFPNDTFLEEMLIITPNGEIDEEKSLLLQFLVDDIQWTGSVNNSWNLAENWAPSAWDDGNWPSGVAPLVPNRYVNIIIPDTDRDPVISTSNVFTRSLTIENQATLNVQNTGILTVDPNGSLAIEDGGSLTVSNLLANSGSISITDGATLTVTPTGRITSTIGTISNSSGNVDNFIIQSSSTGTGSVILNNSGVYATVHRWMRGGVHFHLLSIPVSEQDIATFLTANGGTSVVTIAEFNEGTHSWGPWGSFTSGNFQTSRAYMLVRITEGVVSFKGELQQGTKTFIAKRDRFGWNPVGNPYPSGLSVNSFLNTNLEQLQDGFKALYVYDHSAPPGDRYITVNFINGPRILSNTQGFSVRVGEVNNSGSEHPINFNNAMRAHSAGAIYFKSDQKEDLPDWYKLRLSMEVPGNSTSTLIAFNELMTHGIDNGYDAGVSGFSGSFSLYTMASGFAENLSIRALPNNGFENMLIPMGMVHQGSEPVTLRANTQELPEYLTPLLYDAHKGTFTEITPQGISLILGSEAKSGQYFIRMQDNRNTHALYFGPLTQDGQVNAQVKDEYVTSGDHFAEGTAVSFTAIPNAGYSVAHWLVNGQQTQDNQNTLFLERLLGETEIYAVFTDSSKDALDTGNLLNDAGFRVYVVGDRIFIEGMLEENTRGLLFDVSGRKMLEEKLHSGPSNVIQTTGLQEGVYILHLVNDHKHKTKRLFIR